MIGAKEIPFIVLFLSWACGEYLEECSTVAVGSLIALEDDCRSFIHCNDEEASLKYTCPYQTYFNEAVGKCEFDFENICASSKDSMEDDIEQEEMLKESTLSAIVSTPSPSLSAIDEHMDQLTPRPKCARHSNLYYPHLSRCEYYYKCVGGYLTISRCNFNYAWDYQKDMCVPYSMVKCIEGSRLSSHI